MVKKRGRPKKIRLIKGEPKIIQFSPRGRPGRPDETELTVDQYEALRLADLQNAGHSAAGKIMGISRQTFERILRKARQKVADALVNGKIIRFTGGQYKVG